MIYTIVFVAAVYCQTIFVNSEIQESRCGKVLASVSKSSSTLQKEDIPTNVGIEICAEVGDITYYCPDDYICCTPGSPASKCCPISKPLCIGDEFCCAEGHPKVCGKYCCTEDLYCCNDENCCRDEKACCGVDECCTDGNSCCSTGVEKTCCNDVTQACCDGGYGCVAPCASPFNAVGCVPLSADLEDERQEHVLLLLANLRLKDEDIGLSSWTKLFRVLRVVEKPSIGLIAKDPLAKKTVLSHVNCGSRPKYSSQYISTTTSLDVAKLWASKGENLRIGVIEKSEFPTETTTVDLTIEANRDLYLGNTVCKNFAKASAEVLLASNKPIPFKIVDSINNRAINSEL